MIPGFNAIVLDVAVVVVLLFIIFVGALKGVKHTLINFILLIGSFAISFTSYLNVIKTPISDFLLEKIVLGAGVGDGVKLALYLSSRFLPSLILTIMIYIILRMFKSIICSFAKRRAKKNNKLVTKQKKASRVMGGVVNLLLNGCLVIVLLSLFTHPLIGGNKTIEESYVTKYIEDADDLLVDKVLKKNISEYQNILIVKLINGDLYLKVSEESVKDIEGIASIIDKGTIIEDLEHVKDMVNNLDKLLRFTLTYFIDEEGNTIEDFNEALTLIKDLVTETINEINSMQRGEELLEADNTLSVSNSLKKLGLNDINKTFEEIFIIK